MIYRLTYCNKDGVEARVDIQKGLATPVIEVEGTERPFVLSYNNDKGNKSGMFLSSSADIEIYETTDFNIDNLKTSNEIELSVTHYIDNVVSWQGFIIPDFFSIEVRSNPVITMTASDRLGTLKNVTLSDLPSTISLRELAVLCLNKTGLSLPLRTMADFNNGTGINDFFSSKILTQRLSDTKGRSISCYDILSSILTASNSFLVQRSGAWHIINKIQHEAGSGKLYTDATSFINWSDVIFNFSDISIGGRRTIIPVASTVGVFHEFGGGQIYPENYDFSLDLTGWTSVNGFVAVIDNRKVDNFVSGTGVIPQEWTTDPVFGDPTEKKYLVNDNYGINYDLADKPYLRSSNIPVTYPNISQVKVNVEVNATGPYIDSETYRGETNFAVIANNGVSTLHLTGSGTFEPLYGDPFLHKVLFDGDTHLQAVTSSRSVNGVLAVQDGNLSGYNITIRIYGYTKGVTGGRFLVTTLVNSVAVTITDISDEAKGTLYKTERVDNFTKAHDIDTSLFADYLTTGLNGYFYSFPIDDTSLIYNSNNELTSKWTAYNDTEQLPLLQHVTRQKSRLFSVAHDLLSAEIEVNNFDPLAIFVACGIRHTVVSAQFDFFKSNLSIELEEIDFQIASARDFIYSYFGDGEEGIKSIGGISGGGGGGTGTGGGLTPEQLEILSWWKKDPDNPNTIFTEMNAYSKLELSAYGVGDGDGGGGGGSDYERLDTWASYDSSKAGWVLSAFLGNDLNVRVTDIDGRVTDLENSAGSGSVTSVGISVPTGLSVSNSPITSSGVIAIGLQDGYSIPDTVKQGQWDAAYTNRHTHANKTVLDGITSALVSNWNTAYTNRHTHSNKTQLDLITQSNIDVLAKLSIVNGNLQINGNAYATGELSAYGVGTGGGGGGGIIETVYGYGNLGQTFNNANLTDTFNAYTINQINTRLLAVENDSGSLEIGGRNYFSVNNFVDDNKARGYSTIEVIQHEGNIAYRSTNIANNHNVPQYLQGKFEANTQYYLKFNILWESFTDSGAQYVFTIRYTDGSSSTLAATTSQTTRSLLTTAGKTIDYITTTRQFDGTVVVYNIQIEKGTKPTDWSPAPEDQVSDWLTTDVNSLSFIKNKPTTLAGYGITDAVTLNTVQTISGTKTFTGAITSPLYQSGAYNWASKTGGFHSSTDGYQTGGLSIYDGTGVTANFYRLNDLLILGRAANQSLTIDTNSNVSILGNTTTNRIVLSSVAAEAHIEFSRPSYNYITTPLNGGLSFVTNGDSPRALDSIMVLSPNGNVGIGKGFTDNTTSVTAQLHVRGNILATGTTTTPKVIFNAAGWSMEQVGGELQMKHNNVVKMRFTSTGSIVATEEITAFA